MEKQITIKFVMDDEAFERGDWCDDGKVEETLRKALIHLPKDSDAEMFIVAVLSAMNIKGLNTQRDKVKEVNDKLMALDKALRKLDEAITELNPV